MHVGIGYDIHRLRPGKKLTLGGVEIPCRYCLEGHSDADVLLHAIMDALLGAAALRDIGSHFPPDDPAFKGASSILLLQDVRSKIEKRGFIVGNVDSTVIAEEPRIAPFVDAMRERIASAIGANSMQVMVKATTNEGLDAIGAKKAIAALAVAILLKREES